MPTTQLHTITLSFNLPMKHSDIDSWHGAVGAMVEETEYGNEDKSLFHNHDNSDEGQGKNMLRYPAVQYRVHNRQASIFAMGRAAEVLDELHRAGEFRKFNINGRKTPVEISQRLEEHASPLKLAPKGKVLKYKMYRYIPFNPKNYREYKDLSDMTEKVKFLEELLANHLIAFAKAVDWKFPKGKRLEVKLFDIDRVKKVKIKGKDKMAFDLVFKANAQLPDRIGLGNDTAFGFGWIFRLPDVS